MISGISCPCITGSTIGWIRPFGGIAGKPRTWPGAAELVEVYRENGPSVWLRLHTTIEKASQFGTNGYLALLIGQQVEYRQRYQPSADELRIWNAERQKNQALAMRGLTVRETLEKIRSPNWEWRKS